MRREYHQPCRNKKDKKTLWRNICQKFRKFKWNEQIVSMTQSTETDKKNK